jgi:hypothetical protein
MWVRLDGAAANVPAVPPAPPVGSPDRDKPDSEPQTPGPGSITPNDDTAPTLQVRYARKSLRRLRRTGRMRVKVRVNEAATIDLTLRRGRRRVAHKTFAMKPGKRAIYVRPRRSALRWLRRGHARRLRFSAVAVDSAKNDTVWTALLGR